MQYIRLKNAFASMELERNYYQDKYVSLASKQGQRLEKQRDHP